MATEAQVAANRRNAQHSTGPRTDQGKAAAAQNAHRHGLRSASPVGPGEDPAEYQAFATGLIAELKPVGISQHLQAERIAQLQWKLLRIPAIEAERMSQMQHRMKSYARENGSSRTDFATPAVIVVDIDTMMKLQTYEMRLSRALDQARKQLLQMQQAAKDAEAARTEEKPRPQENAATPVTQPAAPPTPAANPQADQALQTNWVRSADPPDEAEEPAAPANAAGKEHAA